MSDTATENVFGRYVRCQVIVLGELRRDKDGRLVVELTTRKDAEISIPAENLIMGIRENACNDDTFPFEDMTPARCSNCKQCTCGLCHGILDFINDAKEDEERASECPFYIPDAEEAEQHRKDPESYPFYTGEEEKGAEQ